MRRTAPPALPLGPTRGALVALPLLGLLLAGCSSPDARLPGVYTDTAIDDEFSCGALLFPQGCAIVRFPEVHSGCEPEVPGYVVCNGTVEWTATSGSVLPGSRLVAFVNGTEAAACSAPCTVNGTAAFVRHFDAAGERRPWNLTVEARLEVPGDVPEAGGRFALTARFVVRTEPPGSLSV